MYTEIFKDFTKGMIDSLSVHIFFRIFLIDPKLKKIFYKLLIYNVVMHIAKEVIMRIGAHYISLFCSLAYFIVCLLNILFNLLHFTDLLNVVSKHYKKINTSSSSIDMISVALTSNFYHSIMYLTINIIATVCHPRIHFIIVIINFCILNIYHSMYFFGNLWQHKKVNIVQRISLHETIWPYYFGYSFAITMLALFTDNVALSLTYNIYSIFLLSLPFLLKIKTPSVTTNYPKINLSIFSNIVNIFFSLIKKPIFTMLKINF